MASKRQKSRRQLELAFVSAGRGEAPSAESGGTELPRADCGTERQASEQRLMEAVCEPANIQRAVKQVMSNRGSAGVDGMGVKQLPKYLSRQWPALQEQLLSGRYVPQPLKRVEVPKPGGGVRKLGIPTVVDRMIQQALLQVLQPVWDATFSEHSFGFRPGRSAHQAVAQAKEYIGAGYGWVVDIDLEQFFDRVNHDMLMGRVAKRVEDKRVLGLLRGFLTAGVLEGGLVSATTEGTPQGGPLSPLLSNLLLDDLDRELERRGHRFVRYADDCNIYVRSERAGERVLESVSGFITRKLKLRINAAKSAVAKPSTRKFLGFSFTAGAQRLKLRIAPQAIERFKARVRDLTPCTTGRSLEAVIAGLKRYMDGWLAYFGHCETPTVLKRLDGWIRRRLRAILWHQWGTGPRRFDELRQRGVSGHKAAAAAGTAHGTWRMSHCEPVCTALPNGYFTKLGLPTLAPNTTP